MNCETEAEVSSGLVDSNKVCKRVIDVKYLNILTIHAACFKMILLSLITSRVIVVESGPGYSFDNHDK